MNKITGVAEAEIFTCPGTAAVGDAVYISASRTVAFADVDDRAKFAHGIIWRMFTATTCKVRFTAGIIHTSGLTAATDYYLTGTATSGNTLSVTPSAQHIGMAISTTELLFLGFQAFSTDGTFASNSDIEVPTEQAVKEWTETTQTRYLHIPYPELGSLINSAGAHEWIYDVGNFWAESTATGDCFIGIELPNNAIVTSFKVLGQEVSSTATVFLEHANRTTGARTTMATIALTAAMTDVEDTTITDATVDNEARGYNIGTSIAVAGTETRLRSILITYTVKRAVA